MALKSVKSVSAQFIDKEIIRIEAVEFTKKGDINTRLLEGLNLPVYQSRPSIYNVEGIP